MYGNIRDYHAWHFSCSVFDYIYYVSTNIMNLFSFLKYTYILKAFGILAIITLISSLFRDYLDIINIALMYIIPVVVVAIHGNVKSTILITLLSVVFLNFLYIPPLYSFNVGNELYMWSFMLFGIVGWIVTVQAKSLNTKTRENELRESLLHIISHDLRTPLSTIHGTINLLLTNQNLDKDSIKNLLEDINDASIRMKRLITNILDSTRLSSQNIDLKVDWCDFEDIIGVALEDFTQKQNEEILEINIGELELFWGDNTLLTQMIVNLLDNAFKYSKKGSKIELNIKHFERYIKIEILNQSDYIYTKKLENIFDKFYRLEDTNDISGSGIGLAICKSIVELHSGKIKAKATDDSILIEIVLPITKKAGLV